MAPKKPSRLYEQSQEEQKFWQGVRANPRRMARDVRSRFRELDRRLADVEAYVTRPEQPARPRDRAIALERAGTRGRMR